MDLHPSIVERLARLTPDQRAAATAPPGPVLCVAPGGLGQDHDARRADRLAGRRRRRTRRRSRPSRSTSARPRSSGSPRRGPRAARCRRRARSGSAPSMPWAARSCAMPVVPVEPLVDRAAIVAELWPDTTAAERRPARHGLLAAEARPRRRRAADVAADPEAGPLARAFVAYEAALAARGGLDFDDLVRGALDVLEARPRLLARWRAALQPPARRRGPGRRPRRSFAWRSCWPRPANRIFLVGDDDQSIYGWRLADVRRVLALEPRSPGLRRVDLEVNHRCPAPVVDRAVRLIEHNRERFAKVDPAAPGGAGALVLAPDPADEPARTERLLRVLAGRRRDARDPGPDEPRAPTGRRRGARSRRCRSGRRRSSCSSTTRRWTTLLAAASPTTTDPRRRCWSASARSEARSRSAGPSADRDLAAALLAWAAPYADLAAFVDRDRRDAIPARGAAT